MICKACCRGADVVAVLLRTASNVNPAAEGKWHHAQCDGPARCDCQHKVELQAAGKAVAR